MPLSVDVTLLSSAGLIVRVGASVAMPGGRSAVSTFDMPGHEADSGVLCVEYSGVCGTDVSFYARGVVEPCILGHHVVGIVSSIGPSAATKWGIDVGSRVVVEEYLPCQSCNHCERGDYRFCSATDILAGGQRIGMIPVSQPPALWGGNAEYMYLAPNSVVHPVPPEVSPEMAVWVLPLANALDWLARLGEAQEGEMVVILGPGLHGVACVVAARSIGIENVVVGGLSQDGERLTVCRELGARAAVAVDEGENFFELVGDMSEGEMADVVVDTTGGGRRSLETALGVAGRQARVVLTGLTSIVPPFNPVERPLSLHGARGRKPASVSNAIRSLPSVGDLLAQVPTDYVSLGDAGMALRRQDDGKRASPHVVIDPWAA